MKQLIPIRPPAIPALMAARIGLYYGHLEAGFTKIFPFPPRKRSSTH
jgi:hypothetical protein